MLGYITEKQAKKLGATHHGSYYGIPIWMGDVNGECPLVLAKFYPFELFLIPIMTFIEQAINDLRGNENMYMFKVLKEIG